MGNSSRKEFELKESLVEFYLQGLEKDEEFIQALKGLSNPSSPLDYGTIACIANKLFQEIRSDFIKQAEFCYELGAQPPNRVTGCSNAFVEEFLEMGLMLLMSRRHIPLQSIALRNSNINEIHQGVVILSRDDSHVPCFEV